MELSKLGLVTLLFVIQVRTSISNMNQLSLQLYEKLKSVDNLCFSPISISIGLGMILSGARQQTEREIRELIGLENNEVHNFFRKFIDGAKESSLITSNKIFIDQKFKIHQEYLKDLNVHYNSGVGSLDFTNFSDTSTEDINKWVSSETNGMITELFPVGSITGLTRAVIVNTIYFKGFWKNKFVIDESKAHPFIVNSQSFETTMMHTKGQFNYLNSGELNCQVLELPYKECDLSMIVILPNAVNGLDVLESDLKVDHFETFIERLEKQKVEVILPKFKIESGFSVKQHLIKLGVRDLFNEKCNLSGVASDDISVSDVFHKAVIDVNEEGTTAAAATGKVISKRSLELIPEFIADHPFMYLLFDRKNNVVIFMGKFSRPNSPSTKDEL